MSDMAMAQQIIAEECDAVKAMLLEKNRAYGNSALEPMRIFSQAPADEQIRVRVDDKLSRLARGSTAGEDVERDLLGYLILLRVARRISADGSPPAEVKAHVCKLHICGTVEPAGLADEIASMLARSQVAT